MLNKNSVYFGLFAMVFALGAVASNASAAPLTAAELKSVTQVLASSARSQVSLEAAVTEIETAALYNSASLTELKALDLVNRVVVTYETVSAILSDEVKKALTDYIE